MSVTAVERAIGGVLFIDEAYSLKREGQSGNDYGQTAIDTLVSLMTGEEYGGKFACIMAGYPEEMRSFIDANPGLRSRFPKSNFIHLPNYSNEELIEIAEKIAADNDYILTEESKSEIGQRLDQERVDDTFGNARTVRNIVLEAIFKKGAENTDKREDILQFTVLNKEDFLLEKSESTESPEEKLNRLIGLDSIKEEMNSLISFVKMQQYRRKKVFQQSPFNCTPSLQGTLVPARQRLPRFMPNYLGNVDVLKRGHLIVTSRADFVAGYVGQTAVKQRKRFVQPLAVSYLLTRPIHCLVNTAGDFGKEVIDTLVDEMTKHNENLVVILAGYPNEMNILLESNPGLRSRFKKFFLFPDYRVDELLAIMESYAGSYQYEITSDAQIVIKKTLEGKAVNGNGRFATNLVDEMIQAQAMRLLNQETKDVLDEKFLLLEAEDAMTAFKKFDNTRG